MSRPGLSGQWRLKVIERATREAYRERRQLNMKNWRRLNQFAGVPVEELLYLVRFAMLALLIRLWPG